MSSVPLLGFAKGCRDAIRVGVFLELYDLAVAQQEGVRPVCFVSAARRLRADALAAEDDDAVSRRDEMKRFELLHVRRLRQRGEEARHAVGTPKRRGPWNALDRWVPPRDITAEQAKHRRQVSPTERLVGPLDG